MKAPGISRIIWPVGSVQREAIEIADLYQQLGTVLQGLGPRIGDALAAVEGKNQSNVDNFLAFAETGEFSKPRDQQVDIADDTSGLLIGFSTFLVSEALLLDDWHVEVALGVNPLEMSGSNASCPYWECNCGKFLNLGCTGYDSYSQCLDSYWWYGNQTRSAYTLSKDPYYDNFTSATHNEKDPTTLMQAIFANTWSTGQLLLENAGTCVFQSSINSSFNTPALREQLPSLFTELNAISYESQPCQYPVPSKGFYIEEIDVVTLRLNHPNETLYDYNSTFGSIDGRINFNCTTQLNLTVLQDWASVWYKHRHLT